MGTDYTDSFKNFFGNVIKKSSETYDLYIIECRKIFNMHLIDMLKKRVPIFMWTVSPAKDFLKLEILIEK